MEAIRTRGARRRGLRSLLSLAVLATALAAGGVQAADEIGLCEPNVNSDSAGNSPASANQMNPPVACSGALNSTTDQDWYAFPATKGSHIVVTVRPVVSDTSAVFELTMLDPTGADVTSTSSTSVPTSPPTPVPHCTSQSALSTCVKTNAAAGAFATNNPWKIGIKGRLGVQGRYALSIQVTPAVTVSAGSCEPSGDASNDKATPRDLESSTVACLGELTLADQDWYTFDVTQPNSVITVVLRPATLGVMTADLVNPAGTTVNEEVVATVDTETVKVCNNTGVAFTCTKSGAEANGSSSPNVWRVGVKPLGTSSGRYVLAISVVAIPQDVGVQPEVPACETTATGAVGGDAGDDAQTALPTTDPNYRPAASAPSLGAIPSELGITIGACQGSLSASTDNGDNYTITLNRSDTKGVTAALHQSDPGSTFIVCVKPPDAAQTCDNGLAGTPRLVRVARLANRAQNGVWTIKVMYDSTAQGVRGGYLLTLATYDN